MIHYLASLIGKPDFYWLLHPDLDVWILFRNARFKNGRLKSYCFEEKIVDAKLYPVGPELFEFLAQHETNLLFEIAAGLRPPPSKGPTDFAAIRRKFDDRLGLTQS
jgi:hypothetical protein